MFALLLCVAWAFEPFYEEVNCADFGKNCRECVRYTQDFKDFRRGCEWCSMPNYFDSYCFNPNTTVCTGTVQDVCQLDPVIISVLCVLCAAGHHGRPRRPDDHQEAQTEERLD